MEYKEFVEAAAAAIKREEGWSDAKHLQANGIVVKWQVGGETGGSCWGGDLRAAGAEEEPDLEQLDTVLSALTPGLSFLTYKKILKTCVERSEETEREYYGNWTRYALKTVDLERVHEVLVAEGLLEDE